MNRKNWLSVVMASLAVTIVLSLDAATYYKTSADDDNANAWSKVTDWEGEGGGNPSFAPNNEQATGTDFCIRDGRKIRTTTAQRLYGTITIGDESSAGYLRNKITKNAFTTYVDGLVLKNGSYIAINSNVDPQDVCVSGKVVIASGEQSPFLFRRNDNSANLGFVLAADISGETGTAFTFEGAARYNSKLTLSGNNSAYKGQINLLGFYNADYVDFTAILDSPSALGGPLSTFDADAVNVTLYSRAELIFTPNVGSQMSAENRGMTVSFTGSNPKDALYLVAQDGVDLDFALPITYSGATVVPVRKAGPGKLTLSGEYSTGGTLSADDGVLVAASPSAIAALSGVNAHQWVKTLADVPLTLAGKTIAGGRMIVGFDSVSGKVGTITLASDCSVAWPIEIELDAAELAVGTDATVVKVAKSLKTVTAADFTDMRPYGLPKSVISIDEDPEDSAYWRVRFTYSAPVAYFLDKDTSHTFANASWSDGQTPVHTGTDYAITNGYALRSSGDGTFAGNSLTLVNAGSSLYSKTKTLSCADIYLYPGTMLAALTYNSQLSDVPQYFNAAFHVYGTPDDPAIVQPHNTAWAYLNGPLSGSGCLRFKDATQGSNISRSFLAVDSPDFTGSITVYGGMRNGALTILTPGALGGALDAFDYKSFTFLAGTTTPRLTPQSTMTLETANRGILVSGSGIFEVTNGVELVVKEPITFAGTLRKTGAGTLALGARTWFENAEGTGVTDTPTADKNILVVSEGAIKPASADAFDALRVEFAEGTTLALDLNPSDAAVADKGLVNVANGENPITIAGDTLTVRFDGDAATVGQFGIATLATRALAEELAGKVAYARIKGRTAETSVRDNDDGTATVVATLSGKGLVILLK